VLGWGGYWGWDPVENAGLLPWFTATAFLHSLKVQERRGMLRVWNVSLVVTTFFLTIFGTFMTRSGIVQSVHAFGEDRQLAIMFSVFMVVVLAVSYGYIIYRLPLLRPRHELDSWVSRESAVLANNWLLLFAALFVLFATMFPTLSEAIGGERMAIGAPFFAKWTVPIGLALLLLTGIGPLLGWRRPTAANLRGQLLWPAVVALVTGAGVTALRVPLWAAGICFALCAFVAAGIVQEFVRGALVRHRTAGIGVPAALASLIARSRRRYGGYVVHLGVALMFVGFAGTQFKVDVQALLKPGEQASAGAFVVRHDAVRVTDDGQKQMITAEVTVFRGGREVGKLYPARWLYRKHEQEPATEVAIRRGLASDLYVIMPGFELQDQSVSLQIIVNPLVSWIWVGFCVLALGALIALMPDRVFRFAAERAPEAAVPSPPGR